MKGCYKQETLLFSESPKLYTILAFLSAIGLNKEQNSEILVERFIEKRQILRCSYQGLIYCKEYPITK